MYEFSPEYEELGRAVIDALPELWFIRDAEIRIGFLKSWKEKKTGRRLVYGECIKPPELYQDLLGYDFFIVIYEVNAVALTLNQKKILMWHELLHVGIDDESGEPKYVINPHDREEFDSIISRAGLKWDEPGADVPDILAGNSRAVIPRE
mgnify:CR=1 FL=1